MNAPDEELRALGASLREIDPSALQRDPDEGQLRWFQGEQGTELFTWAGPKGVDHAQLVFRDASVEWSEGSGLLTGSFSGGAAPLGGRYDRYLVRPAATLDLGLCRAARTLLHASATALEAAAPFAEALDAILSAAP